MNELDRTTAAVFRALRERDENTFSHCDRTCALAVEMARSLGLAGDELAILRRAAGLHDIGKIGIPDSVLLKPGRLDYDEVLVMRTHPRRGHDILCAVEDATLSLIAGVVLHHHEAIDGSGYPDGLKGEAIPILSRIVGIVDAYDAIATVRPYHRPKTHTQVMRMLFDEEGRKFDPYVLAAFARTIASSPYKAAG